MSSKSRATCTQASHEATKANLLTFLYRNEFIGVQEFADDDPPMVLANCVCGSTLGLEVRREDL